MMVHSNILIRTLFSILVLLALSACQYEELNRSEFLSSSTGNAIAHNSALQIIDPWPRVAGNNNLRVPAVEYGSELKAEDASPSPTVLQASGKK